jgi:hypothetical protein
MILRQTWLGWVITAVSIAVGVFVAGAWGSVIGTDDWRIVSVAALIVGAIGLATIEELGRPQNPYRNLDPRFSYMDAGPRGEIHSASHGWLLHLTPMALSAVVLIIWLIVS